MFISNIIFTIKKLKLKNIDFFFVKKVGFWVTNKSRMGNYFYNYLFYSYL